MSKTKRSIALAVLTAICAICLIFATIGTNGISAFAAHQHSGDTALTSSYLKTLEKTDDEQNCNYYDLPSGNYYLTGDVNIASSIRIQDGASVSLCLNGYTLAFVGSSQYRYPVIEVIGSETYKENGTTVDTVTQSSLTITDCSASGSGTIDGNDCSGSVIKSYLADITIEGGNITGGRGTIIFDPYDNNAKLDATQDNAEGETSAADLYTSCPSGNDEVTYVGYAYGDESFYLQGGGIYALDTNLTITGGVIYGNGAATSSATYNGETVKQYLRWNGTKAGWGGDGYRMTQTEAEAAGYTVSNANGIYVEKTTNYVYRTFTKGDQIDFQRTQGGGIFIGTSYEWSGACVANGSSKDYRSTFVMSGGSISNNVSACHGAGMFVHNVDYTMKGGVIGGSTQYISAYTADGLDVEFINGGNTCFNGLDLGADGGGMYVYRGVGRGKGNEINITGTAEISYNKAKSNSAFTIGEGSNASISGSISISHNHSTSGGVASVSSTDFEMTGGVFEYNTTDSGQAGLSVSMGSSDDYAAYSITIKNCYFRYNNSGTMGDSSTNGASGNGPLSVSVPAGCSNIVTVQGVTVTDNTFTGSNSVSLTGGKLTVKDCTITNNTSTGCYSNGTISATNYAGIYISRPITLTFTDCTITGNSATSSGAVAIQGANQGSGTSSVYQISNIVIDSNPVTGRYNSSTGAYTTGSGGAFNILNGTSGTSTTVYNISNVTITNNEQYGTYGGMYVANSTYGTVITMTDCNISYNTCTGNGGGIYFGYNVTATLTDCDIVGNSTNGSGGGIFANSASANNSSSTLTLTDCSITGNQAGLTAAGNGGGVYLGYGVTATMTDCTVTGNSVGIQGELNEDGDAVETTGRAGNGGGIYLTAANAGSTTVNAKAGASLIGKGLTISGNTATSFGGGIFIGKGAIVTNSNYVTTFATVMSGASVVLSSSDNGKSYITGNSVIGYYNGTSAVNLYTNAYGGGVYVENGYTATTKDSVTQNTYNYYTGHSGSFTMTYGSISGNTSLSNGGGIYAGGSVTLTGVNVNNNSATGMEKDYYISGTNVGKGLAAQGGGIYVTTTSNGYMTTSRGGAYVTLTLTNCSVSGNTSNGNGAGMSLNGYGLAVVISGTTINNNTIDEKGVVNTAQTETTLAKTYGSYLSADQCSYAYGSGGGMYISSIRSISISGGDISYNTSRGNGGGIAFTSGTVGANSTANTNLTGDSNTYTWSAAAYATEFTIKDGTTITNNKATASATTVYSNLKATAEGASLTENASSKYSAYTAGNGGGVYLSGYSYTFSMTGGSISSNSANNGGGLYVTATYNSAYNATGASTVTLSGVTVKDNEATVYESTSISTPSKISTAYTGGNGGGIYIAYSTALPEIELTANGETATTVTGNVAEYYGGGIYIGNSNATNYAVVKLTGSSITANYTKYNTYANSSITFSETSTGGTYATGTTPMYGYGAGVYAAGINAQLIVSGAATVTGNAKLTTTSADYDTATANNVFLNGNTTYLYVGDLSEGASIYVTASSPANNRYIAVAYDSATLSDEYTYIHSDNTVSTGNYYTVIISDSYIAISTTTTTTGDNVTTGGGSAGAGTSTTTTNEAFNLTITLTGTNATITGTTSGYYETYSELQSGSVEFKIIISDGYYFSTITIDGVTYSYTNSTSNLTSTGTATVGLVSSVTITAYTGYITVKITYVSDISGMVSDGALAYGVSVTAAEVGDAFYVGYVDGASVSSAATSFSTTYDGAAKTVTVYRTSGNDITLYVNSFTVQYLVEGEWVTDAPTDIGTYSIRVQWTQTGYVGGTTYGGTIWTMVITAQEWNNDSHEDVTATLNTYSYDYATGATYTPTATVTNTAITSTLTLDTDYVVTYSGNSGAGTGMVTITGIGNYTGSFSVSFTINKVDTFTAAGNIESATYTYSGTSYGVTLGTYTVASDYSGEILYTITRSDGNEVSSNEYITINNGEYTFHYINAGEYTIVIYIEGDANYNNGSSTIAITINKGSSTINVSNVSNTAVTYNGNAQSYTLTTATATTGGASANITYSIQSSTADGAYIENGVLYVTNAGTYVVLFTVAATDNYAGATDTRTFTVNKLTIEDPGYTGSSSFVYDGETHTLNINSYNSTYVTVDYNYNRSVGSHYVTLTLLDTANTQWESDKDATYLQYLYTITQATNSITNAGNSAYTYTYTGNAQGASSISVTSLFASSSMSVDYTTATDFTVSFNDNALTFTVKNAGTYTITFTSQGGSNYTAQTYTITVTVYSAINSLSSTGSTSYSGTYNGSALNIDLGSYTASLGENVTYTVYFGGTQVATSTITSGSGYMFNFTNAGTYTVVFSSAASDNYSSDEITVTVTVAKAANSITLGDITTTYTYSGANQSVAVSGVTATYGTPEVSVDNINGYGSYADGYVTVLNAGTYTVTFTVAATDNYQAATQTLTITVNKFTVENPISSGATYVYNGEAQTFTFSSDAYAAYYTVTGNVQTNAGSYYVYVALNDTKNYEWADSTLSTAYIFTINKATPSYTVPTGLSYVAGTVLSTISLPSGWAWDDVTQKVSTTNTTGYLATYTPDDTANYNVVSVYISIAAKSATISSGISSDVTGEVAAESGFTDTGIALNVNNVSSGSYDVDEDTIVETVVSSTELANAEVVAVYEINLTSNGNEVTVSNATDDGYVTVTVALPSGISSDFYIVHIHDGNIIQVITADDYTVSGGYVTFTVSDLSQFAFVTSAAADVSVKTVIIIACVDVALVLVTAGLIALNQRRKRKANS